MSSTEGTMSPLRVLTPSLVLIGAAVAAALSLPWLGVDVRGFTWYVAALVAAFSLSGSV